MNSTTFCPRTRGKRGYEVTGGLGKLPAWLLTIGVLTLASSAQALAPQFESYCFATADSGDNLVFINKDGDGFVDMGATGTGSIEAMAINPDDGRMYAVNGDNFGFLDYDDAFDGDGDDSEFIQISADVGTCTLPASQGGGTIAINDVDGLQFDFTRTDASTGTFVLWASVRDGDGAAPDDLGPVLDYARRALGDRYDAVHDETIRGHEGDILAYRRHVRRIVATMEAGEELPQALCRSVLLER